MSAYCWPPDSQAALLEALCYASRMHFKALSTTTPVTESELRGVINALESIYSPLRSNLRKPSFPDFAAFRRLVLTEVEWTSTPGLPFSKQYTLNSDLFGWNGVTVDDQRTRLVYTAFRSRWNKLLLGTSSDPISLFIKPEPHKQKKRDTQAWRIIHNVSIVDNLIARVVFGSLFDAAIKGYEVVPNKAGWAPSSGGFAWLHSQLGKQKLMADKSAWDFTMQGWPILAFAGLVDRLFEHLESEDDWKVVAGNHLASMFGDCTIAIGEIRVKQLVTGVMKSGWLGTICVNSISQVALHVLACMRLSVDWRPTLPYAMGDDTIQDAAVPPRYLAILQAGGCIVKEFETSDRCAFAGHLFDSVSCVPAYVAKHCWMLLHPDPTTQLESLESYQYLYALHPEMLSIIQTILLAKGGTNRFRSRDLLRCWYHGWETGGKEVKPPPLYYRLLSTCRGLGPRSIR